eukprot:TRINITY_DN11504_c0_g1_i1.p1 TRINITY_DN11504_c0_g1~~TRINITY_DN11504_c0_g1_i1.p1  ORF type:complete len:424 (-),score=55.39 TRINITY_DN11504_c0_g1_i1:59-1330(-)
MLLRLLRTSRAYCLPWVSRHLGATRRVAGVTNASSSFVESTELFMKHFHQQNYVEAEKLFTTLCKVDTSSMSRECWNVYLEVLYRQRKYQTLIAIVTDRLAPDYLQTDVSYSLLLRSYYDLRQFHNAVRVAETKCSEIPLTSEGFTALIGAFLALHRSQEAENCLNRMISCGVRPSRTTFKLLLSYHRRSPSDCDRVYKLMLKFGHRPDLGIFNLMLYANSHDAAVINRILMELDSHGLSPNEQTYEKLIVIMCRFEPHARTALMILNDMEINGFTVPPRCYARACALMKSIEDIVRLYRHGVARKVLPAPSSTVDLHSLSAVVGLTGLLVTFDSLAARSLVCDSLCIITGHGKNRSAKSSVVRQKAMEALSLLIPSVPVGENPGTIDLSPKVLKSVLVVWPAHRRRFCEFIMRLVSEKLSLE